MKKSVKILTLVLSLALICGAVVVAAFAAPPAVTGVENLFFTDFTGGKTLGNTNGSVVSQFTIDNKGSGSCGVEVSDDGNSYFYYTYKGNTGTATGNYSYTPTKPNWAWTNPSDTEPDKWADYYWKNSEYYVIDVDVYFPDDVPAAAFRYYLYNYYVNKAPNKDGVVVIGNGTEKDNGIQLGFVNTPSGGINLVAGKAGVGEGGNSYAIDDNAWNHITTIVSPEVKDNSVVLTCYTALNGTIIDIYTYTLDENAVTSKNALDGDWTTWYPKTLRFDFGGGDMNGNSVNIDNVSYRRITDKYEGNLAELLAGGVDTDITTWDANIYDADSMPFGTLVATIGEEKYDAISKAIAAADGSAPIVLQKDITAPVIVDRAVTIECGEYTIGEIYTIGNLIYTYDEDSNTYTIEAASDAAYIEFMECSCPLCEAGETSGHPVYAEAEGYLNNKIAYYYEQATGMSANWSISVGPSKYTLVGWIDDYDNVYALDAVVTEEMIDNVFVTLYPVVETEVVPVEYVQSGTTKYTSNIATAISNATEGTTIKLHADVTYLTNTTIMISKSVTIDLNGNVLALLLPAKTTAMKMKANKTLTFLGEKEGSAVIHAYSNQTAAQGTFLTSEDSGATINFVGKNLVVSAPSLYGNWNPHTVTINVDGAYVTTDGASDNPSTIYHKGQLTFNATNGAVLDINIGVNYANAGSVVTLDNAVVLRNSFISSSYNNVAVNIKDSYIYGTFTVKGGINVSGTNYFTSTDWLKDAKLADGLVYAASANDIDHAITTHPWVIITENSTYSWNVEATTTFTASTVRKTYGYVTTDKVVTINIYDGEKLVNTVTALPGAKFNAYTTTGVPVADGWVLQNTKYWYTVADDAAGTIDVDIKDIHDRGISYVAGTPKVYLNYRLSDNLATNLYVPVELPEGVVLKDTTLNTTSTGRTYTKGSVIGGVDYQYTQGWPSAWTADGDTPKWVLTYEYKGNTFTYTVSGNVVTYAKKVVATYGESDTKKMQQITALLQYVEAANLLKGQTPENGLSDYLDTLQAKYTLPSPAGVEGANNIAGLSEYISGAKVALNPSRGGSLIFTLTEKAKTDKVGVKIIGKQPNNDPIAVGTNVASNGSVTVNDTVYTDNAHICNWAAIDITINIYDAQGEVIATGTYSLAAYYNNVVTEETPAAEVDILKAMYALAVIGNVNN